MAATKSTTEATAATTAEIAARGTTDETGLGFTVLSTDSVWNPLILNLGERHTSRT